MTRYALVHIRWGKLAAWPCGRNFVKSRQASFLLKAYKLANIDNGGTDVRPVLDIMRVSKDGKKLYNTKIDIWRTGCAGISVLLPVGESLELTEERARGKMDTLHRTLLRRKAQTHAKPKPNTGPSA